jgi:omega-6 fatty acid desaturase (delta-12 desaturase)
MAHSVRELNEIAARYHTSSWRRAGVQVVDTFVPMALLWAAAAWVWPRSVPLALLSGAGIGALQLRICMFQHDCGHYSFLPTPAANDRAGSFFQLFSLMPYYRWRREHAIHHASSGNLDRRGIGDVDTMTVREYAALSPGAKLAYRLYRHPLVLFGIGPLWQFIIRQRWPSGDQGAREASGVWTLDAMLVLFALGMGTLLGFPLFFAVQFTASMVMGSLSIFIFFVQHQHEDAYWAPQEKWDYARSALQGSSWHKIHPVLQWLSGNIGIHHVHHLSPRIPNYELRRALAENEEFQQGRPLSFWESLKTPGLKLWDEDRGRMVGFGEATAEAAPASGALERARVQLAVNGRGVQSPE